MSILIVMQQYKLTNYTEVLNRAADKIRNFAASTIEKPKSGHPCGAIVGA